MPRLKPSRADARRAEVEGLICRGMVQQGLTYAVLAKRLGVTSVTLKSRRAEPETFTVGEIRKLSKILGIPEREFAECLFCVGNLKGSDKIQAL